MGVGGSGSGERPPSTLAQLMASRAPEPWTIRRDAVRAAEAAAREVAVRVHPTREAERHRQDVLGYLKRLLGSTFGFEVFAFGSVPLKTYLPDGDADITVLANTWLNNSLIDDVRQVLELERTSPDAEFEVKSLTFIDADVKLLKCVIENIIVDISFNQIGGVSTFCFLELIDREVGKDHLFKRSIMLIKAWCYHESRILGAHHGLLSTYALETLVLYIFNLFHKSLHGPLEALYRFLEYFSKFDWDKYGINLNGPVLLSSLPDLTLEPTVAQDEQLLGQEFLEASLGRVVVVSGLNGRDTNFRVKFINIIDPLKESNNLGRSVNKASFYRIRSAFSFGAQKLGQILTLPSELIPDEIYGFFANTLQRHGNGERPDLGNDSAFESLFATENAPNEDVVCLKMSCITEGENKGSCNSSKLSDKESKVVPMHKTSSTYVPGDIQDLPWNKIWFTGIASDFSANSSCSASFTSHASFSQQNGKGNSTKCFNNCVTQDSYHCRLPIPQKYSLNILIYSTRANIFDVPNSYSANKLDWTPLHAEKKSLPPFSESDILDISGDLDLYLGCLRKVNYHLEYLYVELKEAIQKAWLAGEINEDFFKLLSVRTETKTRPQRLTIVSSTGTETRKSSPVHSTEDVTQQSLVEDQADVVRQKNVPLSTNGLSFALSPLYNSDNYLVSWLSVSPASHGTGTYIPRVNYEMYRERMERFAPERGFMPERERRQRPRLANRQLGQWCSGLKNEHTAFQSTTSQVPVSQKGPLQDISPSKSIDPEGGFLPVGEQTDTGPETKQTTPNSPKVLISLDVLSPAVDNSSKDSVGKERQTIPQSSGIELPHFGQGNPPASSICQLKAQAVENLEFGSMGPFSLGLLSAQFEEAFPPLPKKPAQPVHASVVQSPQSAESRPEEAYRLQDEAEFPALKAGCR
ncbi:hypothetical protein EJB05_30861, partial [Eragrostis curvula]